MSKTTEIRLQTWTAPLAANATSLLSAQSLNGSTVTSFTAQPDFARVLSLVASGVTTANVTVNGTDILGNVISEVVALNGTTPVDTVNAYATVTSIVLPTVASTTINIGITAALGLDNYCDENSFTGFAGESSYSHNATVISKNFVTSSTTLNGSTDIAVVYIPSLFAAFGRGSE